MEKTEKQIEQFKSAPNTDETQLKTLKSYSLYEKAQKYLATEGPYLVSKVRF
jgi:hypothetical protein